MSQKFTIGRYYFNSLFRDQADKSFIEDLMSEPFVEEKNFEYAIGNLNAEENSGKNYLRGTFGRVRKGEFGDVYDKNSKEFKKSELPEVADVILEFIISHEDHIVFLEYNSQINPRYFASKLIKIYTNTKPIAELEIDFIFVEKDVFETIQHWQKVDQVTFKKLRPTNPSSLDYFKDVDELLRETGSVKTNIEFNAPQAGETAESSNSGLDYKSKLIKQGIALSSHGYGEAKLKGVQNGSQVEVESKKFLKKVEINFNDDGALDKITQTIEEIKNEEN